MATISNPDYTIDYEDERLTNVTDSTDEMILETNQTYDGMINASDKFYNAQIDAVQNWGDKQAELQQERTDFTIETINQQKDQANKDYVKEQSGAYVDWQKQSNQYGAEAEKMAANGLTGTGYSESSQVSMYNTYQNRVATAREVYNRAVLNYDNAIKDAMLQNNAALAEIAFNTLQSTLQLSLEGFQYKNTLIQAKSDKIFDIKKFGHTQYMDILGQINTENALKENVRQFNEGKAFEAEQNQIQRDWKSIEAQLDRDFEVKMEGIKHEYNIKYLNAKTKAEKERIKAEYDQKVRLANQKLANNKALIKNQSDQEKAEEAARKYFSNSPGTKLSQIVSDYKLTPNGITNAATHPYAVNTAHYRGSLNSDAKKYGTFSNGYQPKGISGHGKLKKTGDKVTFNTKTLSGQKQTVTQSVWKAEDGTLWYWEGRQNKYIKTKKKK